MEDNLYREPLFPRDPPSFFRRAGWKIKNIWTFIRNIPHNIIMICQWIPILWNNWDWDYTFLFNVMSYKMKRMAKHIRECGHLEKSDEIAFEIEQCVSLIKQIQEDNFVETEQKAHDEKWGETRYEFIPCDHEGCKQLDIYSVVAREQGKEEQERAEQMAIYDLSGERLRAAYKLLFDSMNDKIMGWWD